MKFVKGIVKLILVALIVANIGYSINLTMRMNATAKAVRLLTDITMVQDEIIFRNWVVLAAIGMVVVDFDQEYFNKVEKVAQDRIQYWELMSPVSKTGYGNVLNYLAGDKLEK